MMDNVHIATLPSTDTIAANIIYRIKEATTHTELDNLNTEIALFAGDAMPVQLDPDDVAELHALVLDRRKAITPTLAGTYAEYCQRITDADPNTLAMIEVSFKNHIDTFTDKEQRSIKQRIGRKNGEFVDMAEDPQLLSLHCSVSTCKRANTTGFHIGAELPALGKYKCWLALADDNDFRNNPPIYWPRYKGTRKAVGHFWVPDDMEPGDILQVGYKVGKYNSHVTYYPINSINYASGHIQVIVSGSDEQGFRTAKRAQMAFERLNPELVAKKAKTNAKAPTSHEQQASHTTGRVKSGVSAQHPMARQQQGKTRGRYNKTAKPTPEEEKHIDGLIFKAVFTGQINEAQYMAYEKWTAKKSRDRRELWNWARKFGIEVE